MLATSDQASRASCAAWICAALKGVKPPTPSGSVAGAVTSNEKVTEVDWPGALHDPPLSRLSVAAAMLSDVFPLKAVAIRRLSLR